jgi:hypothetical protein
MTTNVAIWDRDIGMPRRNWASLWRAVFGPGRSGSPTERMRVADLDERMLRDIGFEPQSSVFGTPLGWAVEARAAMSVPAFLGR